jgi:hypothetical protein
VENGVKKGNQDEKKPQKQLKIDAFEVLKLLRGSCSTKQQRM